MSGANIIAGTVVESLMVRSFDEPFTFYGLLAETVETDAARSHVTFTLNPAARLLRRQAGDRRRRRRFVAAVARQDVRTTASSIPVAKAEIIADRTVRF